MTVIEATKAFEAADKAWAAELPKVTNARYLPIGRGEPGSKLRQLYEARNKAANAHHAAWRNVHSRN